MPRKRPDQSIGTPRDPDGARRARRDDAPFDRAQGVFMISVAAKLAGMHPQTLRVYEARGLIKPDRSPKQTRLYSQRDVERLRRIQELTTELGLNLAGVEQVLSLEETMHTLRERLERLEGEAAEMEREMLNRIEAVHRSYRRELVLWEPPGEVLRKKQAPPLKIAIERARQPRGKRGGGDGAAR